MGLGTIDPCTRCRLQQLAPVLLDRQHPGERRVGPGDELAGRRSVDAAGIGGTASARSLSRMDNTTDNIGSSGHKKDHPARAEILAGCRDSGMGLGRVELPTPQLSGEPVTGF
jgi:hypothetical protein